MSAQSFEVILVRLYTDPEFRRAFMSNPEIALGEADLTLDERADLIAIDRAGLLMASSSFLHKRRRRISYLSRSKMLRKIMEKTSMFLRRTRRTAPSK